MAEESPRGPFTLSQVMAAQLAVELAESLGEEAEPDMIAIASAVPVEHNGESTDHTSGARSG
jgi:hypothetical protein